jgi:hypothetical protein
MAENGAGCARPTGAKVGDKAVQEAAASDLQVKEIRPMMTAKVGSKAPDFEAPAYYQGKFGTVKLSDYLGKWVLVCFYPGDFTFV